MRNEIHMSLPEQVLADHKRNLKLDPAVPELESDLDLMGGYEELGVAIEVKEIYE